MISFGSFCSGIEAASVAWLPLGMKPAFYSEIEPFPISVLKYRHAAHDLRKTRTGGGIPLWGDMAAMRVRHLRRFGIDMPDLLVAGTPCQGFSFAGLRGSLSDARSNLALTLVRIAHAIDNVREREGKPGLIVVWENVPGVLSTDDNAFGCFLGAIVGSDDAVLSPLERGRWPHAGMVAGPRARAAWRVLDAQFFGLAQRRERVFAVIGFRDAIDPAAILFERVGMRGNSPPRRETRKDVAPTISARAQGGGGLDTDFDCDGGLVTPEISLCLNGGGMGRQDAETETLIALPLRAQAQLSHESTQDTLIVAEPIPINANAVRGGEALTPSADADGRVRLRPPSLGIGKPGDPADTVTAAGGGMVFAATVAGALTANGNEIGGHRFPGTNADGAAAGHLVAFTSKDYGADAQDDLSPTLRSMGHKDSHPNAGGQIAIAIQAGALRENPNSGPDGAGFSEELGYTIEARAEVQAVARASAVRRLTPRECERLQGFEDDYTLIPTGKRNWGRDLDDMRDYFRSAYPDASDAELIRLAADGPRYKALGNSKATKVVRWIGARILANLRGELT